MARKQLIISRKRRIILLIFGPKHPKSSKGKTSSTPGSARQKGDGTFS
jgi:hypothetical protein